MNYEDLYEELQLAEKELKDKLAAMQRLYKNVGKETESGDIKTMGKDLSQLSDLVDSQREIVDRLKEKVQSFDAEAYFGSGEFVDQMLACCRDMGVDVRGEAGIYEMFPYRVRIDMENQDLYLDRKKVQCMRPQAFVATVKQGQDKLNKASFNAAAFATELSEAYDIALLKSGKEEGADLYLLNLYKILTPMSRSRKEYDQQNFAFDLARLYASGTEETKTGRRFQFGPSRNNNKAIRILNQEGQEQFLATIRFF